MRIQIELLSNKPLNIVGKSLCVAAIIAMLVVALSVYKAAVIPLAVYIGFAVIYVQLPGIFLLGLLRVKMNHISTALIIGFFIGWAFIILQFFLCELINSNLILYGLSPICTIFYIAGLITHKRFVVCSNRFKLRTLSTSFCIFITIVFLYAMASTQYLYINPADCVSTYMNPDKAYHMGLIDSLSHKWPVESLWVQGRIIKYHVFTELLMAIPVRLFGVTADIAIFSFNPIMTTYVFGLSTYVFFNELLCNSKGSHFKNRAGLCSLTVILSNMFLMRSFHTSMAFHFAIINDNAVGYGIGNSMIFVVLFKEWYTKYFHENKMCWKELLLLTVFIMLLTGIKGPIALVLVGAIWGTYVIGIILRKISIKTILPILVITAGFLFIYLTVLSGKGTSNGSGESIFAMATIANIAFFHDGLIVFLKGLGLPKIIRLIIMLVIFMIFMLTAYILPFTIGYIRELVLVFSGKKEYDFSRIIVYAAFLVGLMAMFIMNYSGHSQVYFGLVSVFFAPLITFWFFEDMALNKGLLMNIVRGIFLTCMTLTTITLAMQFNSMLNADIDHSNPNNQYSTYLSISKSEYEAMRWLDENTPEDSLLATDRYSSVPPNEYSYENRWSNRFFLYATYSNRFCYIAGSGYNLPADDWVIRKDMIEMNNKFYNIDNPYRGKWAKEVGVDYLVVSKRFNDFGDLSGKGYSLCFSNEDIDIYELK